MSKDLENIIESITNISNKIQKNLNKVQPQINSFIKECETGVPDMNLAEDKFSEEELENNVNSYTEFDWKEIFLYQNISEEFIRKHFNKEYREYLMANENISEDIKEEIKTLQEII